jgi:U3 small nucleolar RNA-associated protein 21
MPQAAGATSKPATASTESTLSASKLYYPYRALGVVTDGVPFVLNRLGEECFVTTSVGKSFQVQQLFSLLKQ